MTDTAALTRIQVNSQYLTTDELAALVGCEPNQRAQMVKWLDAHHWKYELDRYKNPKVARAYHDRKMGISDSNTSPRFADGPNLQAFA